MQWIPLLRYSGENLNVKCLVYCTLHVTSHTFFHLFSSFLFLLIRSKNSIKLSWNLNCKGNRGGMTSGDLSGTDQGPGTDLSGTSEPLRSRMRSLSSRDLASPLHRWADISNCRSSMVFTCFKWTVQWESPWFVMRRSSCCWRLFKFYMDNFLPETLTIYF